ncbi:MAG: hypothetical protein Q8R96_11735 [Bacteroidota bacterium]|nr:hypothetical protein [Bacteroidota bacterium]
MNEFFSSTLWAQLKSGKTPEVVIAREVYIYFSLTAVISGLLIIVAAHYYGKR